MRAIQFSMKEEPKVVSDVSEPTPADDELVVEVISAALDTALDQLLSGSLVGSFTHSRKDPIYLGWHYSGTVKKVGKEVSHLKPGDDVFGFLPYDGSNTQGSLSEFISVRQDTCSRKPASISHDLAAASATETLTALQAMRDQGKLAAGKRVIVVGGAGGVGAAAIGIAKKLGALNVTAVCSSKDVDMVKSFGADVVIDRKKIDPLKTEEKFDLVFDTPGANTPSQWFPHISKGGAYVTTLPSWGLLWGYLLSFFYSRTVGLVFVESKEADLSMVGRWLEEGLKIPIHSTFPIKKIKEALEKQRGRKNGRIVVKVKGGW